MDGEAFATRRLQAAQPAAATDGAAARPAGAATAGAPPGAEPEGRPAPAQLDAALGSLASLLNSSVTFWAVHAPDSEGGGFFTFLDQYGAPSAGDVLVLQFASSSAKRKTHPGIAG